MWALRETVCVSQSLCVYVVRICKVMSVCVCVCIAFVSQNLSLCVLSYFSTCVTVSQCVCIIFLSLHMCAYRCVCFVSLCACFAACVYIVRVSQRVSLCGLSYLPTCVAVVPGVRVSLCVCLSVCAFCFCLSIYVLVNARVFPLYHSCVSICVFVCVRLWQWEACHPCLILRIDVHFDSDEMTRCGREKYFIKVLY